MKKLLLSILLIGTIFTSCKKTTEENPQPIQPTTQINNLHYLNLSLVGCSSYVVYINDTVNLTTLYPSLDSIIPYNIGSQLHFPNTIKLHSGDYIRVYGTEPVTGPIMSGNIYIDGNLLFSGTGYVTIIDMWTRVP